MLLWVIAKDLVLKNEVFFTDNIFMNVLIVSLFIYQLILLTLHRYVMVRTFIPDDILEDVHHKAALKRMYFLGMRFDMKVVSIFVALPLCLLSLLVNISSVQQWLALPSVTYALIGIVFIALLVINGIVVGNYYYFKTYNNYYDIFMFGLVEDDTQAVLKNIYDDYPIISLSLGLVLIALLPIVLLFPHLSLTDNPSLLLSLVLLVIFVLMARGTIHSKPLGKGHAQVGNLGMINKMVPNGITAMGWAFMDKKRELSFESVKLEEGIELLKTLGAKPDVYANTPSNTYLKENKPHVFFALMESMGTNIMVFDDEETNDLLGNLRGMMKKSFVFKRFCAGYNGTAPTLANLFFHSHIQNISQSVAQKTPLLNTPFFVYKSQGYKTVFITGGNMMWRNLANYLPIQGVDALYDQNDIIELFPEAKETLSYWGVADEYAFKVAEKLLRESEEPLFISLLSMTNHPPYEVPTHYQPYPLNPDLLLNCYGKNNKERLDMLQTYQYACDALGRFMQRISEDDVLGSKTILSATGDHHVRSVYEKAPSEIFLAKAVPFFVYIPSQIQEQLNLHYDEHDIGNHKDIMPTLYQVSLSNTSYWHGCGRNLFNKENSEFAFVYNDDRLFADKHQVVDLGVSPYVSYEWSHLLLDKECVFDNNMDKKIKAYQDFLVWQTNYLVTSQMSS